MKIKQFQANWVQSEDRILFCLNTADGKEYCLWLTRRISYKLIKDFEFLSNEIAQKNNNPQKISLIHNFKGDLIKEKIQVGKKHKHALEFPLGKNPLLVTDLSLKTHVGTTVSLYFKLINESTLKIELQLSILQAMVVLITELQAKSMWNFDPKYTTSESFDSLSDDSFLLKKTYH